MVVSSEMSTRALFGIVFPPENARQNPISINSHISGFQLIETSWAKAHSS
jgi:hypothetical protein